MYCNCLKPNIVKNSAMGEYFEVCSEKLGGCGKEVRTTPPPFVEEDDFGNYQGEFEFGVSTCATCEGAGFIGVLYPWGHTEVKCDDCTGTGVI